MDITQGIRARHRLPYPHQQAPNQPLPRWKAPVLTTTHRPRTPKEAPFMLNSPDEITLRVKWEAISRNSAPIAASCINGDYAYEVCSFYDPSATHDAELAAHSAYQAIALHYQGYGTYRLESKKSRTFTGYVVEDTTLQFEEGSRLASQPFVSQSHSPLILRRRLIVEQTWLVTYPQGGPVGQMNVTPYYGYGVYAKAGSPLDKIEQVYARLTTRGSRTAVELKRFSALRQQGLAPPVGGKEGNTTVIYPGISQNMPYSLSDAIVSGEFTFTLHCQDEMIVYRSLRYTQENADSQLLDIVFVAAV